MAGKTLRVSVVFISDEDDRRFIAHAVGRCGKLATAAEIRSHYRVYGAGSNADENEVMSYERCDRCNPGNGRDDD
jgi:hypothetical protein